MKTKPFVRTTWLAFLLSAIGYQPSTLLGQGPLTPPGAPTPTMKSLDQIEARTPIAGGTTAVTISQGGSYYLTGNLTVATGDAITMMARNVTLDLNGFTISSSAASANGSAILITSNLRNITIMNGFIKSGVLNNGGSYSGSGFVNGISAEGNQPDNVLVSHVSVAGVLNAGIFLTLPTAPINPTSSIVESCAVHTAGSYGIVASTIKSSVATDVAFAALLGTQISDCRGEASGFGDGIRGTDVVQNSSGFASGGTGITALNVNNSIGQSSTGHGISANTATGSWGSSTGNNGIGDGISTLTASNCYGSSVGGQGISAYTATNCYATSNTGQGISATTATNCCGGSNSGQGISTSIATNCRGVSLGDNRGISCDIASGCYGQCNGGSYGIYASEMAFLSYGGSSSGTGLRAHIANSCVGQSTSGTGIIYDAHYNMTPNNYPAVP